MKQSKHLLWIFLFVLSVFGCKEKTEDKKTTETVSETNFKEIKALVLFSVGDVKYGDEKVKIGQTLLQGKKLVVGKRSNVDLQIIESDSEVSIKIQDSTEFLFEAKPITDGVEQQYSLIVGSAMFQMKKGRPNDQLKVVLPTTTAAVRGTKFVTTVKPDKTSSVTLIEGKLGVRPRVETLENLPKEVVDSNELLSNTKTELEKSEVILEPSQKYSVQPKEIEKFVESVGLEKVLKDPEIITFTANTQKTTEDNQKISEKIKNLTITKEPTKEAKPNYVLENLEKKEFDKKLKEFEEIVRIEKEKIEKSTDIELTVKSFNKDREKQLQKKIEVLFDLPTEVLILKDGTKHKGVILEEGGKIIVLSPEGKKEFNRADIDSREDLEE